MRLIGASILLLISLNVFGQNIAECGLDDNPKLSLIESEFLNAYLNDIRDGFDFKNKKVIFITGTSGNKIGSKKEYFEHVRIREKENSKVVTGIHILSDSQKRESRGYDVIVTYWVKVFTDKRKRKILKKVERQTLRF